MRPGFETTRALIPDCNYLNRLKKVAAGLAPNGWRTGCIYPTSMSLLFEALRDLADLALGCTSCKASRSQGPFDLRGPQSSFMGGLVNLSGGTTKLHVGVLATPQDCSRLAGRLLGQAGEAHLPQSLVRGAMCELAYLLAGGVKRRLSFAGALSVGQPAFFAGAVEQRAGWDTRVTYVELDAMRATLISVAPSDNGFLL